MTKYGDISPAVAGVQAAELLTRAIPYLIFEKFGQTKPLPSNSTSTMIFRRYNALSNVPVALAEGVTPAGKQLTKTDVSVEIKQYGDFIELTDVVQDLHTDPVLQETQAILGEQAGQMLEKVRYNVLKAGTSVFYANGATRAAVNTKITTALQRKVTKTLKRQSAKPITTVLRSTPAYETRNVKASYIAIGHTDIENDVRDMAGFKAVETYGSLSPYENEVGAVEDCRYLTSTLCDPFADAGGAAGGTMQSTSGTNCDVFPVIYLGKDAWACVPLKGKAAITPTIVNPKPVQGDPLGQRGSAGWKAYHACVILNDAWMSRGEIAVTN
ncbi:N4-gp56 family major capsid protein [Variovorax sp. 278MFTsu5.1]|uniref:N4-gp56 family major capsid protein n=1 Tax=Variovorax sp. 278MFTsu5.1 TaxID=3158366 RepID=UPI003AABD479